MKIQVGTLKTKLLLGIFGFWLLGIALPVLASTLVEPGKFILVLNPGARTTDTINVKNVADKATVVKAVVYDWTLNDRDELVATELGSRKDSLNGLIKFNPRTFKLDPGANQLVRFTITAPKDSSVGELRGIVFFEEENSLSGKGVNAKLITEVGSTIYAALTPIQLKFRLFAAKVVVGANTQAPGAEAHSANVSAVLKVRNEGSSHARYTITYKVVNDQNVVLAHDELKEKVLLPGFQRTVSFPISGNFNPGKYNLLLEIKFFNTDQTLVHSVPFAIEK